MYLVLPAELNRESTVLHFWMYYKNVVFPFAFQLPTSLKTSSHCWIHLLDHLQPLFIDNKNCTENVWHWHEYFIYMDHKWVWALESFSKATKNLKKSWTLDEDAKAKNHCFLWFFFPIPYVKELCGCLHYWTTEVLRKNFRFQSLLLFAWWITIWDFIFTLFFDPWRIFSWISKVLPIKQILLFLF